MTRRGLLDLRVLFESPRGGRIGTYAYSTRVFRPPFPSNAWGFDWVVFEECVVCWDFFGVCITALGLDLAFSAAFPALADEERYFGALTSNDTARVQQPLHDWDDLVVPPKLVGALGVGGALNGAFKKPECK